ncbi:MAG TPA: preprotein translocase subunit SecE [Streptosporangiaceae bacterium]|nr:preprotein translocase subunit SecE [Streptosporangiaceae bacterium]
MATQVRGPGTGKPDTGKPTAKKSANAGGSLANPERTTPVVFVREVRSELRKVIWPTRKELVTYTTVAVIFILVMVGIVTSLDTGLTNLVFKIFG